MKWTACILFVFISDLSIAQSVSPYFGAWIGQGEEGVEGQWIFAEKNFSVTYFKQAEFLYTAGGYWSAQEKGKIKVTWEYHSKNADRVGQSEDITAELKGNNLTLDQKLWKRVDDGSPGQLAGAWLITGRYQDGELRERVPGARKTMKILSGKRFQWIAYNVDTKEFLGTGGGNYTTQDGQYTEHITFFSRDNTRVGASLQFDFKREGGKWHHQGLSSKGDPIHEVWTKREQLEGK